MDSVMGNVCNINNTKNGIANANVNSDMVVSAQKGKENKIFEGVVRDRSFIDKKALSNNTYNSLLKEADDVKSQIMSNAANVKDNLKALFNKLESMEDVNFDKNEIDLNEVDEKDMVNIVDRIRIGLASKCEGLGFLAENISVDKIKEVVGNTGLAEKIESEINSQGLKHNKENIDEICNELRKVVDFEGMSEESKYYIIQNSKMSTMDNIEIALGSTFSNGNEYNNYGRVNCDSVNYDSINHNNINCNSKNSSNNELGVINQNYDNLRNQMEQIIENAGLEVNDKNLEVANEFIKRDIPLTPENLILKSKLDDFCNMNNDNRIENMASKIIDNMINGGEAVLTEVTADKSAVQMVKNAIKVIENSTEESLEYAKKNNAVVSIKSLEEAIDYINSNNENNNTNYNDGNKTGYNSGDKTVYNNSNKTGYNNGNKINENSSNGKNNVNNILQLNKNNNSENTDKSDYKMLMEIRILMTSEAGINVAKKGIDIENVSISLLHKNLLAYDRENLMEKVANQLSDNMDIDEIYETSFELRKSFENIKNAPAEVMKELIGNGDIGGKIYSLENVADVSIRFVDKIKLANKAYETFSTLERRDFGDSILKAVDSSAKDILNDLNMEDSKNNRQALKILAYNEMDINAENINSVKYMKSTLDNIIKNISPNMVLDFVKNKKNPMKMDIRELNDYINAQDNANMDKYSTFLYKLDKTGGISESDRRQFIEVYKMFNIFKKDAGNAIGNLIKNGNDITMKNLMETYNSDKNKGSITYEIADDKDIEVNISKQFYMNLFGDISDFVTPLTLKNVNDKDKIIYKTVENFCEDVVASYDDKTENEYMKDYLKLVNDVMEADDKVIYELERCKEKINVNNIQAMQCIMESGFYNDALGRNYLKSNKFVECIDDREKIKKELENMCEDIENENINKNLTDENINFEIAKNRNIISRAMKIVGKSAKRQDYRIPYINDKGLGTMRLTLKSDDESIGKIFISSENDTYGKYSIEVSVNEERVVIDGNCSSEINYYLNKDMPENVKDFENRLKEIAEGIKSNFKIGKVEVNTKTFKNVENKVYDDAYKKIATPKIYKMAKFIVEQMI